MRAFLADPLAFIRNNVVVLDNSLECPNIQDQIPNTQGVFSCGLKLAGMDQGYERVTRVWNFGCLSGLIPSCISAALPATETRAYIVVPARTAGIIDEPFNAYICPWSPDKTHLTFLGAEADLMFNGLMDGCSFGVGIPCQDGVLVSHSNARAVGSSSGADAQRTEQRESLQSIGATNRAVLAENYRASGVDRRASVFGIRDAVTGSWDFWAQGIERVALAEHSLASVDRI